MKKISIISGFGSQKTKMGFPENVLAYFLASKNYEIDFYSYKDNSNIKDLEIKRIEFRLINKFIPFFFIYFFRIRKSSAIFCFHTRNVFNFYISVLKKIGFLKKSLLFFFPGGVLHDLSFVDNRDYPLDNIRKNIKKNFDNFFYHHIYKTSDFICNWSEHEKNFLSEKKIVNKNKMLVVPCGYISEKLIIKNDLKHILFIGQMKKRKGWDVFFDICKELNKKYDDLNYLFITPSDLSLELKEMLYVSLKKDIPNLTILNKISDKEKKMYFQKCGILIFPTRYEGFGLPVIEAMDNGMIVIASDVPAVNEIIVDKENGFLCNRECVEDFVFITDMILSGKFNIQKIKENAIKSIDKYSPDLVFSDLIKIIEEH